MLKRQEVLALQDYEPSDPALLKRRDNLIQKCAEAFSEGFSAVKIKVFPVPGNNILVIDIPKEGFRHKGDHPETWIIDSAYMDVNHMHAWMGRMDRPKFVQKLCHCVKSNIFEAFLKISKSYGMDCSNALIKMMMKGEDADCGSNVPQASQEPKPTGPTAAPSRKRAADVDMNQDANQSKQRGPQADGTKKSRPEDQVRDDPQIREKMERTLMENIQKNSKTSISEETISIGSKKIEKITQTQCETVPEQHLKLVRSVYVDHQDPTYLSAFENVRRVTIDKFRTILDLLSSFFRYSETKVKIFYGSEKLIGFNRAKVLYFNLKVFEQKNYDKMEEHQASAYWLVVYAHELAHNEVENHDKSHEWAMECYLQNKIPQIIQHYKNK